jgi:hypothetical protein
MVVMHERDIRKRRGDFAFVRDPLRGPRFLADLTNFVQNAAFTLVHVFNEAKGSFQTKRQGLVFSFSAALNNNVGLPGLLILSA